MSRGRKRGARPQHQDSPLAALQALKANDPTRPVVAAAVLAKLRAGTFSPAEKLAASALLTPADWRGQHGEGEALSISAFSAGSRPTLATRDHFAIRRTATIDGGGIRWTEDMVREEIADAMDIMRRMRFPSGEVPSTKVAAAFEIVRTAQELWDMLRYAEVPPLRAASPTPGELARLDSRLPWLFAVEDWRHRMSLTLRAGKLSWRRVAERVSSEMERRTGERGIDHKTAQRWEARAVGEIVGALGARRVSTNF